MELIDIWFTIRNKHGWLADCAEAGYSKAELDAMEKWEDSYHDLDLQVEGYSRPMDSDESKKIISEFRKERNTRFPELDNDLKDFEIERARNYPLFKLLNLHSGERIPCPFHNGKDDNFMVKDYGFCFVCNKPCDSISWQMEFKRMSFKEAVRSLN
jgi:hypothetical protein